MRYGRHLYPLEHDTLLSVTPNANTYLDHVNAVLLSLLSIDITDYDVNTLPLRASLGHSSDTRNQNLAIFTVHPDSLIFAHVGRLCLDAERMLRLLLGMGCYSHSQETK